MKTRYQESKPSIIDLLKCHLCFNKIQDAMMCPNCQRLSCQHCIHKYLIDHQSCPCCHLSLKYSQVIKVSFMNDVASYIETIKKSDQNEVCTKHFIQMLYYCNTCNISLCSDCCMFENEHKTHTINRLHSLYDTQYKTIKEQSKHLDDKYKDMNMKVDQINSKINELNSYSSKKTKEIKEFYENMKKALDNNVNIMMNKLVQTKNDIMSQMTLIEQMKKDFNKEVDELTKSQFISKCDNLMKTIQHIENVMDKACFNNDKGFDLDLAIDLNESAIPSYKTFNFEILDFKKHITKQTEEIILPEVKLNGLVWILKMYPNGLADTKNKYLAFYLELKSSYGVIKNERKYHYRIEMVNWGNYNKNVSQEYSNVFAEGDCWGYNKFHKIEQIESDGFISKEGKLEIRLFIRADTIEMMHFDMNNYIKRLETIISDNDLSVDHTNIVRRKNSCPKKIIKRLKIAELLYHEEKTIKINQHQPNQINNKPKEESKQPKTNRNKPKMTLIQISLPTQELIQPANTNNQKHSMIIEQKTKLEHQKEVNINQIMDNYTSKIQTIQQENNKKKSIIDKYKPPLTKKDTFEVNLSMSCYGDANDIPITKFPLETHYNIPKSDDVIIDLSEESSISIIMESMNKKDNEKSKKLTRDSTTDSSQNIKGLTKRHSFLSNNDSFLSRIYPENKFPSISQRNSTTNIYAETLSTNHKNVFKENLFADFLNKRK